MDVAGLRPTYVAAHSVEFREVLSAQRVAVVSAVEQGAKTVAEAFDFSRWDRALGDRLYLRQRSTAVTLGMMLSQEVGGRFDTGEVEDFMLTASDRGARNINAATADRLAGDLEAEPDVLGDMVAHTFDVLLGARLATIAAATFTTSASVGMHAAARGSGLEFKVWEVHSSNPRASHAAMRGERTKIGEAFSNGMQWPGDPAGGADELSQCRCSLAFE